ncbi:hypothetical protein JKA74_14535 [Marivirga sp. S37H4]|uniref:Alpha/beta hydrolase n=1 Tax=Marivirga aurantiaca TaxID=2802615 RepID=A0A935C9X2_9BACT|nr:hypothetical protein [Marivirga aurantiaca]MBK6266260.1 hypothetical protein [Marivirga aurantiaca]
MNNTNQKFINLIMIMLLSSFLACTDPAFLTEMRERAAPVAESSNDYAWYPDPGRPGYYDPCVIDYSLPDNRENSGIEVSSDKEYWREGWVMIPKNKTSTGEGCEITKERFPFVVIIHADGNPNTEVGFDQYRPMMEHIVSHGFIVLYYKRNQVSGQDPEQGDKLFYLHTKHVFEKVMSNGNNLGAYMNHDLAIIGHSAGGSTITKLLGGPYDPGKPGIYGAGFNLKAVVFMSPTVYPEFENQSPDFSLHVPSMMGISVSHDTDGSAFGSKAQGQTMKTAFKYYDDFQKSNLLNADNKEMIFVQGPQHYYQSIPFAKSYITAYLKREFQGDESQNKYLKFQQKPSGLGQINDIRHLNWSANFYKLVNFENQNILNGISNTITLDYNNIDHSLYYSIDDPYSPHNTYCVELAWDNQQNNDPYFQLLNSNDMDLENKYLTFTISQRYTGDANMSDVDSRISLVDDADTPSNSINISTFGGLIKPPVILQNFWVAHPDSPLDATKNAMRSYIIPFSAFNGVDLTKIKSIKFEFNDPNYPTGRIILDNISITD